MVLLDPAKKYAPSDSVQILLKPPAKPYVEIAKLESTGMIGEPEPTVIEDARKRAREIGADALIVVDSSSVYQPPVLVYDPWPPYLPWYQDRWHRYHFGLYPPPYAYGLAPPPLPGGNVHTVRSIAIRFTR
jgi:hypothetical protein